MRVDNLADELRRAGLTVVETAGCWTRGHDFPTRPPGKLRHWTAGPINGETPTLQVCTHGRTGLPGPLCNVYQSRRVDGNGFDVVYLVATGKANHAGLGRWAGEEGNYRFLGLEIEWAGPTERFVGVRRREETSLRVMLAMHRASSGGPHLAAEHREYAPTRKIDTNLDGNAMRRYLANPPQPEPPRPPTPKDDKMYALIKGDTSPDIWLTDFMTKRRMPVEGEWKFFAWLIRTSGGIVKTEGDYGPVVMNQGIVDRIAVVDQGNVVDATFKWWAATPTEPNPFRTVVNQILDERGVPAAVDPPA